jgi:hypothetical protein
VSVLVKSEHSDARILPDSLWSIVDDAKISQQMFAAMEPRVPHDLADAERVQRKHAAVISVVPPELKEYLGGQVALPNETEELQSLLVAAGCQLRVGMLQLALDLR